MNDPDCFDDATERSSTLAPRPIPLIGDTTSALDRSIHLDGWAFSAAERTAVYSVIGARRDVRRFRPNPIPEEVLTRVLGAAHTSPSVGQSQPWRFIVVTNADTREKAGWIADRERLSQAGLLDEESARQLLDLQLEGIREAPIGIVVCCDRRVAAAGVLGRATFQDADMWSTACAIENFWLAARAEGLGVGWVTLFPPKDLANLVGLPDGVESLGWLCVGWPDERPPEPGLERAGWSTRLPLSEVVLHEKWGTNQTTMPFSRLRSPNQRAIVAARDTSDDLLTPLGSLGVLDRAVSVALANGYVPGQRGTYVLVGGDHLVADLGVTAYKRSVTADVLAAARSQSATGTALASVAGLSSLVIDTGTSTGDLAHTDALHPGRVVELIENGRRTGKDAAVDGLVVVGEVGMGNTTVAAALTASLLSLSAAEVVGRGSSANSAMLDRKREVVTESLVRARQEHGAALQNPLILLGALGGPEFAYIVGVILGASEFGQCVILDGLATSVCALIACRVEPGVQSHLVAGQRSRERVHNEVLVALGLEPILDLRMRAGEGAGAILAAQILLTSLESRTKTARTTQTDC